MHPSTWLTPVFGGLGLIAVVGPLAAPARADETAETIFRDARAYTVRIRTQVDTPFLDDDRGSFEGAGFLVDAARRWVVTNAHVVGQSPSTVQTAFVDGRYRPARKVYVDSFTDVAVIEVADDGKTHPVASLDCVRVPEIGEGVGAFGHPLGVPFTGTRGIVSGKTDQGLADLLQVDATIDHGNSGGPVISFRDGRVVGIATAGAGGEKADRMNFATPMSDVCRILDLLRHGTAPEPPQMEFSLLVDEDGRHTLEVGATSNAARWPFQPGDRIVSVGDERQPIRTVSNLVTALRGRTGAVPMRVERRGREIEIQARPAKQPSVLARRAVSIDGAMIAPVAFQDAAALGEPVRLVVQSVEPGSAAHALGLDKMDFVHTIDGRNFGDLESLIKYLNQRQGDAAVRIVFRRMSTENSRWFDFCVRDLPGEETRIIGPEPQLLGAAP